MSKGCPRRFGWLLCLVCVGSVAGVNTVAEAQPEPAARGRQGPMPIAEAPPAAQSPSTTNIDTAANPLNRNEGPRLAGAPASSVGANARNDRSGPHMKCWQHGRLIVDKPVKVLPAEAQAANGRVRDGDTGAEVVTFDLKNAMCLIQ